MLIIYLDGLWVSKLPYKKFEWEIKIDYYEHDVEEWKDTNLRYILYTKYYLATGHIDPAHIDVFTQ